MNIFTLHKHAFLKLLIFRVLMVLAYQMMAVAVGWHIYEITHDTLALGLIGLAEAIPYFACALFAGHAVDHFCSRRFFGALSALTLAVNAFTLTMLAMGVIGSSENAHLWIYGSIMLTGIERAFIAPSYSTLFALILPREDYNRASGISSSVFQAGLIIGPAIGGLLVGYASKTAAYGLATVFCLGAAIAMWSIKIKEPSPPSDSPPIFTSIGQGLRFVYSNQIVFSALSLDMFAVLFGGAVAMLPAFINEVYQLGPESLGILRAAPAVGAIMT